VTPQSPKPLPCWPESLLTPIRRRTESLMLDPGQPVHVVAAWHGHDPAVSLSIYADAKTEELRAAGASLFGCIPPALGNFLAT
jgi:hypothetical protein